MNQGMKDYVWFADCSDGSPIPKAMEKFTQLAIANLEQKLNIKQWLHDEAEGIALGIVKLPEPIGYSVCTLTNIRAKQHVCIYGGEQLTSVDSKVGNRYLKQSDQGCYINAENLRGVGGLLPHLPSIAFNSYFKQGLNEIAWANLYFLEDGSGFLANQDIPKYALLGFDYGSDYWSSLSETPTLIRKNGGIIRAYLDVAGATYAPDAVVLTKMDMILQARGVDVYFSHDIKAMDLRIKGPFDSAFYESEQEIFLRMNEIYLLKIDRQACEQFKCLQRENPSYLMIFAEAQLDCFAYDANIASSARLDSIEQVMDVPELLAAHNLAIRYLGHNQYAEAYEQFLACLLLVRQDEGGAHADDIPSYLYWLGACKLKLAELTVAQKYFDEYIEVMDVKRQRFYIQGLNAFKAKNYAEAAELFSKIDLILCQIHPEMHEAMITASYNAGASFLALSKQLSAQNIDCKSSLEQALMFCARSIDLRRLHNLVDKSAMDKIKQKIQEIKQLLADMTKPKKCDSAEQQAMVFGTMEKESTAPEAQPH